MNPFPVGWAWKWPTLENLTGSSPHCLEKESKLSFEWIFEFTIAEDLFTEISAEFDSPKDKGSVSVFFDFSSWFALSSAVAITGVCSF